MKINLENVSGFRAIDTCMNARPSLGPISLKALQQRHRFRSNDVPTHGKVARRWKSSSNSQIIYFISYNTYLMDVTFNIFATLDEILPGRDWFGTLLGTALGALGLMAGGGLEAVVGGVLLGLTVDAAREILEDNETTLSNYRIRKPACGERANELGNLIGMENFDVAALSEVWNAELGARIHELSGKSYAHPAIQAGLFTLSAVPIIDRVFYPFKQKGKANMDSDYYAQKGVMLSRIQTLVGVLDMYLTHLYWGNELPPVPGLISDPSNEERRALRSAQLQEIVDFIKSTHHSENIAVLVGDFNIDANGNPQYQSYEDLKNKLNSIDLYDQWAEQFFGEPPVTATTVGGTERIDYIFIEAPKVEHSFNLDITVIELYDYYRQNPTENQATLSDHRALVCPFLCSPS